VDTATYRRAECKEGSEQSAFEHSNGSTFGLALLTTEVSEPAATTYDPDQMVLLPVPCCGLLLLAVALFSVAADLLLCIPTMRFHPTHR